MTLEQANEMAAKLKETGLFTRVEVEHEGFLMTREMGAASSKWRVNLWSVNPQAGNRNLTMLREYECDSKRLGLAAKVAAGRANKRDREAFARMAAERAVNAE